MGSNGRTACALAGYLSEQKGIMLSEASTASAQDDNLVLVKALL